MFQDLRVALRGLGQARGLALAAVATLALGIGATTVVFTIVEALVLRPLPFGERTSRLVSLHSTHPTQARDWDDSRISYLDLLDLREQARSFAAVEGLTGRNVSLAGGSEAERVVGASVTPGLFSLLGVRPRRGRGFRAGDGAEPGQEAVALVSDALWQRRFGADPALVGRTIAVNGRAVRVIGVMPPGFRFPERHDLWLPLGNLRDAHREQRSLFTVGLLREGVTREAAQSELDALAERLATRYPATNRGWGVHLLALHDYFVQARTRTALGSMLAAVALVLLVACANIASLLLARGLGRRQELTVRAALGAGRRQLVRLLLAESLLLAIAGGVVGLLLAQWGVHALVASNPEPPPYWARLELGGVSLAFVVGVCVLATIVCGLVPALRMSRPVLGGGLGSGSRGTVGVEQRRAQGALVVAQIAASLALLVAATLLMRSAMRIDSASAGFEPGPLLSLRTYMAGDAYDDQAARARAVSRVVDRLAALPGAQAAAATGAIPADDGGDTVRVVPDPSTPIADATGVEMVPITPGLWATLGVPLAAGRTFTAVEADDPEADVAIVNRRLATRLWPGVDPLGRRIGLVHGDETSWLRVVGVAPDLVYEEIAEETAQSRLNLYLPNAVAGWRTMAVLVRAGGGRAASLASLVPPALHEIDPGLAAYDVLTMEQRRNVTAWGERFIGRMFGGFALASLLLACIGTYGLISYAAGRRRREMGVRLAIGATAADIVRLLLGEGARLATLGTLLGLPLAWVAARALRELLYDVSPWEPSVWLGLPAALLVAVLVACYLPARRAGRTEPTTALRAE